MSPYVYVGVRVCVHACVRACVSVCVRTCVRACVRACVRVYMYIYSEATGHDTSLPQYLCADCTPPLYDVLSCFFCCIILLPTCLLGFPLQIGLFASAKSEVADFLEDNTKAMSRFFVSSDEELFTVSDVHKRIEKIVDGVCNSLC